ncbi:hypothetical protein BJX70DRAFT_366297 [Aspergillus crustosus]
MLVFSLFFMLLALKLVSAADDLYWVDSSCPGGVQSAINEALLMAKGSLPSLESPDRDYDVELLFGDNSRKTTAKVRDILLGIANLRLGSPDTARIGIFCDNDNRWTDDIPKYPDNGQVPELQRAYLDPSTGSIRIGPPRCRFDPGYLAGVTYTNGRRTRTSITICDQYLTAQSVFTYEEIGIGKLDGESIDTTLLSIVILHELTHMHSFDLDDEAYGWVQCLDLSTEEALRNADSYALWSLLCYLLDNGMWVENDTGIIHL